MVPKGWSRKHLREVGELTNGINKEKEDFGTGIPFVNLMDVFGKLIIDSVPNGLVNAKPSEVARYRLQRGDILFVRSSVKPEGVGLTTVVTNDLGDCVFSGFLIRLRPNAGVIALPFSIQCFHEEKFRRELLSHSTISANTNINQHSLDRLTLLLPPLHEQSQIANILSAWDRAIEQTQKLIDAKLRLKRGLMQQLLTGKLRFEEFRRSSWKEYRIGDLLEEVKRPITFDDSERYDLISVRRRSGGLFHRGALHGHQIETKNLSIAKSGDFLISRMQVVHGASGLTTPEFDGMKISGSYTALVSRDRNVIRIEYFDLLSRTPELYRLAYLASWGVHIEKMTFSLPLYLKSRIRIPSDVAEQDKIVGIIRAASDEIKKLEESQRLFKEQKRGLMQVLLTGKVRVKVDSAEVQNA